MTKHESKTDFLHKISKDFLMKLKPNEKKIKKSFLLIVTMEYQNVRASVNFSLLIIGPGRIPGL
jgi:hypothetical protein